MATITSVASGLWSDVGTWDIGVPVDDDIVIISAGHTVEFDVDQSGFANGIDGITITGTLKLTRTAGTYYLKIKAAKTINGAGTFDCGTSVSPIPFASKHTVTGGSGWYINGISGMTFTCYASEPTIKYAKLINAESKDSTVLEVDTDVTGDIWADGDTVFICEIGRYSVEERIIAVGGIASGSITITTGLSNAKSINAHIVLVPRNVTFLSAGGGAFIRGMTNANPAKLYGGCFRGSGDSVYTSAIEYGGGLFTGANGWHTGSNSYTSVLGGVFIKNNSAFQNWNGLKITYGIFIGMSYVIQGSTLCSMLDGYVACAFIGFNGVTGFSLFGGAIKYCERGLSTSPATIKGAVFGNMHDVYTTQFVAFNTLFGGSAENYLYSNGDVTAFSESFDHNQVAGAYRSWTAGGITTKQAVTVPVGYTSAMLTVLQNLTKQGYWQKEIVVVAGASVNIEMNLRKSASMAYLPRIIVFNKASTDPFAGGAGLYTFTMTNSIDTWEDDLYTYTNTGTEDVTLVIRCQGMNATGNMYSALDIEQINVDLTSAIALINEVKVKTDQLAFTVPNQVDANALTGGGGATAQDVWEYATRELTSGANIDLSGLALESTLTAIKGAGWSTETLKSLSTLIDLVKAKTDNIPLVPAPANEYDARMATIQADLDNPSQYKADVSGLALESTLTAIKGAGWSTETLKSLSTLIDLVKAKTDNIPLVPAPANEYDARMTTIQADLDNPSQYKADVSGLALESTLTAIKGAGWSTETLKSIKEAISLIPEGITIQDLKDIVIEGDFTFYDLLKVIPAALAGKLNGGGTGTLHFRNLMDTLDRITAEVDLETGDRTSITLDLT